ncbi:DUF1456 family protein [Clostridia bacterium]|nr:DUF1456 family protein [Clostridia bacterium]
MDNNDILIRLRYALEIKDKDMVQILQLGDITMNREEVAKLLTKTPVSEDDKVMAYDTEEHLHCTNFILESFLNGMIVWKRGKQEVKPGQKPRPLHTLKEGESATNVMLKKVKIALSLSSEDMLDIFTKAGIKVSKAELGAFFRNPEHKHYRVCLDKYARNFLKGLALVYREK